jgi:hypothetical protein
VAGRRGEAGAEAVGRWRRGDGDAMRWTGTGAGCEGAAVEFRGGMGTMWEWGRGGLGGG